MPSKKIITPIEPGCIYHIYNRGCNYQTVFFRKDDYQLFLNKMKFFILDYCKVYAFALLPNHYHLLLHINEGTNNTFSKQFSKLILSYTNTINARDRRKGNLFHSYFRRIKVDNDYYLRYLVYYINHNPTKHEIVDDFRTYEFSSYKILLSTKETGLNRETVLSLFGGKNEFIDFHNYFHDLGSINNLTFEDD